MKILYDVTSLLSKNLTPEGVYTKNLFRVLKGLGVDIDPVYKIPRGVRENYIDQHIGHTSKKFINFFAPKNAILHGPSVNLLSESPKLRKVISINDLSMFREGLLENRVTEQLEAHLKQQLQKEPAAIFVPSYDVHNELLTRFPKFLNRVHVIQPGADHLMEDSGGGHGSLSERPYFVFVGALDKKSNVSGVIKAFEGFFQMNSEVNLMLIGDNGYGSDAIHKQINSAASRERIKIMGYKTGAQLKKVYAGAIATVVPSFYESFSYPVVESLKMSCPVIASATGAIKELGVDALHLVNPKDPEQIMAAMERVMVDLSYRKKLIAAGDEVARPLTWLKCAQKTLEVYNQI